jgi:hypothetical protein
MRFPSDDIVADELWLRRVQTLSQPLFERIDPDLNHLTRLGHRVCAVVQGTTQFDSKLAVLFIRTLMRLRRAALCCG